MPGYKHYDDKQCFEAWIDTGSVSRAVQYLHKQGVISTTGEKPHPTSVYYCVIRHIVDNPEETRPILIEKTRRGKLYKSDEYWDWMMIRWIKSLHHVSGNLHNFPLKLYELDLFQKAKDLGVLHPDLELSHVLPDTQIRT